MRDPWLEILDHVLRPARPHLARCLEERDRHLSERRQIADERAHAIAGCERRINLVRADIFATNDGIVGRRMTELEREWRLLSRPDPDAGLMDLWARIAPASWIDRKRWRDSDPSQRLDAAIALAADFDDVEAAEAAARMLRPGARIRWRFCEPGFETIFLDAIPSTSARARSVEERIRTAALARFPDRPNLALDLGRAAAQGVLEPRSTAVQALRTLWRTGYVLSKADDTSVTLEIPSLSLDAMG